MTPLEKAAYQPIAELLPWLGYGEKDSNYDLKNMNTFGHNNYTFIAQYFDDLWNSGYKFYNTRKNGPHGEWCDMTVDYACCMAFGPENARKVLYQPMESAGAGCCYSADYFRANNAWLDRGGTPKTGDQIFFGKKYDESHTGLVEKVDANYVYTIEGNTSDRLLRRSYARNSTKIAGYGRPHYELVAYLFEEVDDVTEAQVQSMIDKSINALTDVFQKNFDTIDKALEGLTPTATLREHVMKALDDEWIETYDNLPAWALEEAKELIDLGALRGKKPVETLGETLIQAPLNYIRSCIVALRLTKKLIGEAPREVLAAELERVLEALHSLE